MISGSFCGLDLQQFHFLLNPKSVCEGTLFGQEYLLDSFLPSSLYSVDIN